ncbi:MAG: hypothetical protein OEU92_06960 [Alphaproteobacteria bacterium]|nr:hypothetical protein [Alphaproteobacteria bacterium]
MRSRRAHSSRRRVMLKNVLASLALAACLLIAHGQVRQGQAAEDLLPFHGSYVGHATVEDLTTGERHQRDLDIVVSPYRRHGLRIDWVTVRLVDGRRDVPGVKRWSQTALFEPADGSGFLVEVGKSDLFRESRATVPIQGDPVRWSRVDGDVLHICTFVVLEDGRYELQVYRRILTDIGMNIHFERIVDGEVVRRVTGQTARADSG